VHWVLFPASARLAPKLLPQDGQGKTKKSSGAPAVATEGSDGGSACFVDADEAGLTAAAFGCGRSLFPFIPTRKVAPHFGQRAACPASEGGTYTAVEQAGQRMGTGLAASGGR